MYSAQHNYNHITLKPCLLPPSRAHAPNRSWSENGGGRPGKFFYVIMLQDDVLPLNVIIQSLAHSRSGDVGMSHKEKQGEQGDAYTKREMT